MAVYWLLFLLFALATFVSLRSNGLAASANANVAVPTDQLSHVTELRNGQKALVIASLIPVILIGLRYEVGTDYPTYVRIFRHISNMDLASALGYTDVGYAALNWAVAKIGADLWLVNLACAILFVYGLVKFTKVQPNPWLAFTVAVPYLVIVVAMGYTRQAVAIGFGMAALTAVSRGSIGKFVIYVLVGALFHRTVVVLIPIVTLAYSRNRLLSIAAGLAGSIVGYFVLVSGEDSPPAARVYRPLLHAIPRCRHPLGDERASGACAVFVQPEDPAQKHDRTIYAILSIVALASLALLLVFPVFSTALDRMALYVIQLPLFVLSRLPSAFSDEHGHPSAPVTFAVVVYCAAVQFVWLNYAANAKDWIPYQFYPFGPSPVTTALEPLKD